VQQLRAHAWTILPMAAAAQPPASEPPASRPAVLVEVAVDSVAGALAAARGGADRIELCGSLDEGGLTPTPGLLAAVRAAVTLPVFVMLRPRRGDFLYDEHEFQVLRHDLGVLRAIGIEGVVTGFVTADGRLDERRLARVLDDAGGLPVTFHRAYDLLAEPLAAVDALAGLGCARILTSGQARRAIDGAKAIAGANARAAGRLTILAGASIRSDHVRALVDATGVHEVHLSASVRRASAMTFRRDGVPMNSGPAAAAGAGEYDLRTTDADEVRRVVAALRGGAATMPR
jgi:copper homeostasis protein